jgi:small ligand-binding sensory domain FIST
MNAAIATALASTSRPDPELAAHVVREALTRAGMDIAQGVLLFLTADFLHHAHAAVVAASRAANCLQVTGCTAAGILTDQDWALDRPAACAMVFGAGFGLGAHPEPAVPLLTLAAPNAAAAHWLDAGGKRYGFLSTDNGAHGAGRIWCHGKMSAEARCETAIAGVRAAIGVSRGVRPLADPQPAISIGYDVLKLGPHAALNTLLREMPLELREMEKLPFHLLAAGVVSGDPRHAVEEGRYTLVPIIAANHEERTVTLAAKVESGAYLFWTMRQPLVAERDMHGVVDKLAVELGDAPDFGVLFSCMGRGPYFFGGEDRDLAIVKERYPGLPLIGAYGGGQIAPLFDGNRVVHNAAVLGLFKADV